MSRELIDIARDLREWNATTGGWDAEIWEELVVFLEEHPVTSDEETLPDLWLEGEDKENVAVADCGCRLVRDYRDSGDPAFFYCEKHRNCS